MDNINPSKPNFFDGFRDGLSVNTWLYQVDLYLNVMHVVNPHRGIDENTNNPFASIVLKGDAANW